MFNWVPSHVFFVWLHPLFRYGFEHNLDLVVSARPKVGERQVTVTLVTDWIQKKLITEFQVQRLELLFKKHVVFMTLLMLSYYARCSWGIVFSNVLIVITSGWKFLFVNKGSIWSLAMEFSMNWELSESLSPDHVLSHFQSLDQWCWYVLATVTAVPMLCWM